MGILIFSLLLRIILITALNLIVTDYLFRRYRNISLTRRQSDDFVCMLFGFVCFFLPFFWCVWHARLLLLCPFAVYCNQRHVQSEQNHTANLIITIFFVVFKLSTLCIMISVFFHSFVVSVGHYDFVSSDTTWNKKKKKNDNQQTKKWHENELHSEQKWCNKINVCVHCS